ncbi:MAG: hypothetical protein KAY65_09960 [Planctomycetes bacterium]|nr:hypothetical protein [Planctomycetota bacterium]
MKKNVIKSFCVVVLQLVAVGLLWPIVLAERGLTWCLWRSPTVGLCGSARSVLGDIVGRREAHTDKGSDYTVVWAYLERCGDNVLAAFRRHVETEWGVPEWAQKDNPHLYAVLLPSREENLQRISYALCNIPSDHLHDCFAEVAAGLIDRRSRPKK